MDTKLSADPVTEPAQQAGQAAAAEQANFAIESGVDDGPRARYRDKAWTAAVDAFDAYQAKVIAGGSTADEAIAAIVELTPVTTLLPQRHVEYLRTRAAMHGETPEVHLESILRQFRSYFDDKRPELTAMEAQRNGGAVTRRVA